MQAKQGFEEALDQLRAQVQEKALCIEQLQVIAFFRLVFTMLGCSALLPVFKPI